MGYLKPYDDGMDDVRVELFDQGGLLILMTCFLPGWRSLPVACWIRLEGIKKEPSPVDWRRLDLD